MFHHAMHNSSRELFESPPGSPRSCDRLAQTAPSGSLRPRSPASGFGGSRNLWSTWGSKTSRLVSTPKSSLRLVEKTKVDNEKFRIWPSHGGRANTPLSYWKEDAVPLGRNTPPTGFLESGMRSALAVGDPLASGIHETGLRNLDGSWVSHDGELRGQVHGEHFYWACDGSASPLRVFGEHQESLCLWLDGVRHFAILGPDGRRLSWADGDVWLRRERHDPELEEAVKAQCRRTPAQKSLCWKKWQLRWRHCDGNKASLRPISPKIRRPVQAESPVLPTMPPLRGVIVIRR